MHYQMRRRTLVEELKRHPWLRSQDLAQTLHVSTRTIRRDVAALRIQGMPIEGRRGKGLRLNEGYFLDPVTLASDEAALAVVGSTVVAARLSADVQATAQSLRARVLKKGSEKLQAHIEGLEADLLLAPDEMGDRKHEAGKLERVRQALVSRMVLQFGSDDNPELFHPYGLSWGQGRWLVIGYSVARCAVCSYRVDALERIKIGTDTFTRPPAYTLSDAPPKDEAAPARVQFDAPSSRWIVATTPDFIETIHTRDDGIVVTLAAEPEPQVLRWILGWGAHARVVAPLALKRRVAKEVAAMAEVYATKEPIQIRQSTLF